jgi:hypothetical protein
MYKYYQIAVAGPKEVEEMLVYLSSSSSRISFIVTTFSK